MIEPGLFVERDPGQDSERQTVGLGSMLLEAGSTLTDVTLAYQTWGRFDGENAILVCHALTGDSDATSWWDRMVGHGRPIDTDRYFVICSNVLGGCQGSTGPSSLAEDREPYGSRFPIITVGDMVDAQARLLDHLGVTRLAAVAGGSMGGMQALEWTSRFPNRVRRAFVSASAARHSAMQIAFNEVGRQAVMRDPRWLGGDYAPGEGPDDGLSVARMLGHLTFLSPAAFEAKFARRLQNKAAPDYHLGIEFEVESYLQYQAGKFLKRFDANSQLILTRAIDYYEGPSFSKASAMYGFVSYTSDWIYPTSMSAEAHAAALAAGRTSQHRVIDLPYGHDAFLLDGELQGEAFRELMAS